MKLWQKIALVALNLALLPFSWRVLSVDSVLWPLPLRLFIVLPCSHLVATGIVVGLWHYFRRRITARSAARQTSP